MKSRKAKVAAASLVAIAAVATVFAISHARPVARTLKTSPPVVVSVPVTGKLATVVVHDGDAVQKGQLIAMLDVSGYEADLKNAEADLQAIESRSQNAIQPVETFAGISGSLPKYLPKSQPPQPLVKTSPSVKQPIAEKPHLAPKASTEPNRLKQAADARQKAKDALESATKELASATAALSDAQKARDAMRPKVIQADVDAKQAAKKAASAKELLDAGVISSNRAQEMLADKDATQKTLDNIQAQAAAADKALDDAQSRQKGAQLALENATQSLRNSDDLVAQINSEPAPKTIIQPTQSPKPTAAPIRVKSEARVVTRRMPLVARQEALPPIPLKVFVDEKSMKSATEQIAELKKRIADLKAKIEASQIFAPASGILRFAPDGSLSILV